MIALPGDLMRLKTGLIAHQVNCAGLFGAGLAKVIADRWPKVKDLYLHKHKKDGWRLGDIQIVNVGDPQDPLYVVNCASQYDVGTDFRRTDYEAVRTCLLRLSLMRRKHYGGNLPIYFPHGYGCGLGGGDWKVVSTIIETVIPDAIIIVKRDSSWNPSE